jgi:EAL domain-containing protein (putative c-di-GMP-specific phosphodiesterase class I)
LRTAAAQLNTWRAEGIAIPLSVNIGAKMLQDADFQTYLSDFIGRHPWLRAGLLRLEVIESSALQDLACVSHAMQVCREMGVSFLLDDFGTGYSSLTYLKRLPIDQLKIDRSFVRDMPSDPDDLAILEAILALAATFGLGVIAEGVETKEHGQLLLQLGCESGQGFAIAAPMPAEAVPAWVQSWKPFRAWSNQGEIADNARPLLHARVEIRALSQMIEALSINKPVSPRTLDHRACRFGKWLIEQGEDTVETTNAHLETAKRLHRDLHHLSAELISLHNTRRRPEFLTRLRDLTATRDALSSAVDALVEDARRTT